MDQIAGGIDPERLVIPDHHHPQWANKANDAGPLASDLAIEDLTLVLSRSPQH